MQNRCWTGNYGRQDYGNKINSVSVEAHKYESDNNA